MHLHSINIQTQRQQNIQHSTQQKETKLKTEVPIKEKIKSNKYFVLQSGIILQKPEKNINSVKFPSLNNSPKKSSSFTTTPSRKRSVLIKKLTDQNKKYLQRLKGLDDRLSDMVNKKMVIKKQTKLKLQTTQITQQLKQAYKQIDKLKKVIGNSKIRQTPIDQKSKICDLQNQIKILQSQSKSLNQQINTANQIKKYQQQQINKMLNTQINSQINLLILEIQEQKAISKKLKKDTFLLQQDNRIQHQYIIELEELNNKLNQNKYSNIYQQENTKTKDQLTKQKEQQELRLLVIQAQQKNKKYIQNIEITKKQNMKIIDKNIILSKKIKQKTKQISQVQKKYHTIINIIDTKVFKNVRQTSNQNNQKNIVKKIQPHIKVLKEQHKSTYISSIKQFNKQNINYIGQKLDDSITVSDRLLFSTQTKSIDINQLIIWVSKQNQVCGLQAIYLLDGHQYFQGDQIGYCKKSLLRQVSIDLKLDKIKKIKGFFNKKGLVSSLTVIMVSEKQVKLGKEGIIPFELSRSDSQIECLQGSFIPKLQGASICQLVCSFKSLRK